MTHQIIMGSPVSYETENIVITTQQWNNLRNILTSLDVDIIVLKSPLGSVFTSEIGVVHGDKFIKSYLKDASQENKYVQHWFRERRFDSYFYDVTLDRSKYHFNASDFIFDFDKGIIWLGVNFGTSLKFKQYIDTIYANDNCKITRPLELIDNRFDTLDKCFCLLDGGYAMWYPDAFSEHSKHTIELWFKDHLFEVSEADALAGACNSICINSNIVTPRISSKLLARLQSKGYNVHEINLDAFFPNGGCKSLALQVY